MYDYFSKNFLYKRNLNYEQVYSNSYLQVHQPIFF